jgi:DNA-binding MarR family transcriptional regulator
MAADSNAARRQRSERPAPPAEVSRPARRRAASGDPASLDNLVHHRLRLGIVSALAAAERLTFNEIKALLKTTDGNLSVHARKLEDAGYVTCTKGFDGRRPRTEYQLTALGRRELARYLTHMEALIRATRDTLGR